MLEPGVTAVNHGSHGHGRDRGQFILKVRDRDVTVANLF